MAPSADPRGSRVPLDLEVWVEMFPFLEPCLVEAAKLQTARYDKYETTKLDSWTRGKVALVGDAAHAMCPAIAQGAGCAMVNAFSLSQDVETATSVEDALVAWEKRIRPITDRAQADFRRLRRQPLALERKHVHAGGPGSRSLRSAAARLLMAAVASKRPVDKSIGARRRCAPREMRMDYSVEVEKHYEVQGMVFDRPRNPP